jgi:hypothetical protein
MLLFVVLLVLSIFPSLPGVVFPTKIKDIVSKMTQITQTALRDRNSRMEIELPFNAEFGVESSSRTVSNSLGLVEQIKKSNRESARLFTEMFSSISSTTTVLFPTESEASLARNIWGTTFRGKVLSIEAPASKGYGKLRSRKFSAAEQEQALFSSDGIYIPSDTEVLIISGPRYKDITKIKKLSQTLTEATLIILLNSRSHYEPYEQVVNSDEISQNTSETSFSEWVAKNYIPVFHYAPLPMPKAVETKKDYLLYHEYNKKWYVAAREDSPNAFLSAVSSVVGVSLKSIWEGDSRPKYRDVENLLRV